MGEIGLAWVETLSQETWPAGRRESFSNVGGKAKEAGNITVLCVEPLEMRIISEGIVKNIAGLDHRGLRG